MAAFPNANEGFPKLSPFTSHQVTVEERITAIDFVNRMNYLFEEFDTEKLVKMKLPDSSLRHMYGTFKGAEELKGFIENKYPPPVPGVTRHATNHIVDRDEETGGVVVRSQITLLRHTWPEEAGKITANGSFIATDMPGIWIWSSVADRLKMTDDGWKLYGKRIGATVVNKSLTPESVQT
ncbi:hypothetical protein HJFPF1_08315 [Paramyrothecium foliicola]|nr:hypothetical protein HJFPF1_08315 [Paramyrothecium foliicola]